MRETCLFMTTLSEFVAKFRLNTRQKFTRALLKNLETEVFDGNTNGSFVVSALAKEWDKDNRWNVATWLFSNKASALEAAACICDLLRTDRKYNPRMCIAIFMLNTIRYGLTGNYKAVPAGPRRPAPRL